MKIDNSIDYIAIVIFVILIIFWCDLDIQGTIQAMGLNTNIKLGLCLCAISITGILLYKYVSKVVGILIFVLILLVTKAMLGYTELFTTTTTSTTTTPVTTNAPVTTSTSNSNLVPITELSASSDEVQQFLLRQIADDPNTTIVDKRVMQDLTDRYFKSSSKLAELRGFNIASESANILPGQQLIVGIDTVKNQH